MQKKALILGCNGQDGSYLSELLLSKGYEVHGVVIEEAGEYILDGDLDCSEDEEFIEANIPVITITASNVNFNGNGYSIEGPGVDNIDNDQHIHGIYATTGRRRYGHLTAITIRNSEIRGFSRGVYFKYVNESEIRNNTANQNGGNGIFLHISTDNILQENIANQNGGNGIYLHSSHDNRLQENTANQNGNEGITLIYSNSNTLEENTANQNYQSGISLWDSSNDNMLQGNTANQNIGWYGIQLFRSSENILTQNTANQNGRSGIFLRGSSPENAITRNTACNNINNDAYIISVQQEFTNQQCDTINENDFGYECERECYEYTQTISLNEGWNTISSYVVPHDLDIVEIFSGIVDQLTIVKDEAGEFYWVEHDYNGIESWSPTRGYQVHVSEYTELVIEGYELTSTNINLKEGWNTISYPLDEENDMEGEEGIIAQLIQPLEDEDIQFIIRNDRGNFYESNWEYNGIESMMPGKGYHVKVSEDTEFDFSVLE